MRITKNQLRQIIKEELEAVMGEKKFPDLTGDGKVTQADILKGRGVIDEEEVKVFDDPTYKPKPEPKPGKKKKSKDFGNPRYNPPENKPAKTPMKNKSKSKADK